MKNIIITGGELFNKGAEAMTFITVDELKKRFPRHNIYLLSEMDLRRPKEEREKYAFSFMGWYPIKFAKAQRNPILKLLCKLKNKTEYRVAEDIYKNTDLMVDISGYALGSNWGDAYVNTYLEHLEYAKAFDIPVYLMSQSFGPFHFSGPKGKEIDEKIKNLLPTVKVICAREEEGYNALVDTYELHNVQMAKDIVLNNKNLNMDNIFKIKQKFEIPVIEKNSVGIIPNQRNFEVGNSAKVYSLYYQLIQYEIKNNHKVYLLSHSAQDTEICRKIKQYFINDGAVVLLEQDFSSIEFNEIVKQFLYVIASRFHSVVHAYKNGVPCIVLGWATKYHNLTQQFNQGAYMIDVRGELDEIEVIKKIDALNNGLFYERETILTNLEKMQQENVFDILAIK